MTAIDNWVPLVGSLLLLASVTIEAVSLGLGAMSGRRTLSPVSVILLLVAAGLALAVIVLMWSE